MLNWRPRSKDSNSRKEYALSFGRDFETFPIRLKIDFGRPYFNRNSSLNIIYNYTIIWLGHNEFSYLFI